MHGNPNLKQYLAPHHLRASLVKEPVGKSPYVVWTEMHRIEDWCLAKKY